MDRGRFESTYESSNVSVILSSLNSNIQVYLPALQGHLPTEIVRTFRAFLEFCYTIRRNVITGADLINLQKYLSDFHHYRTIFETSGVRPKGISLPRQHALVHYHSLIRNFGAPNGLCSSITESKHIRAVKEPWRRSNRNIPLGQMLISNQRLDQLAAARSYFTNHGMLEGPAGGESFWNISNIQVVLTCHQFDFLVNIPPTALLPDETTPGQDVHNHHLDVSTPDEDPNDGIVKDLSVLAEVKLSKYIRKPI